MRVELELKSLACMANNAGAWERIPHGNRGRHARAVGRRDLPNVEAPKFLDRLRDSFGSSRDKVHSADDRTDGAVGSQLADVLSPRRCPARCRKVRVARPIRSSRLGRAPPRSRTPVRCYRQER